MSKSPSMAAAACSLALAASIGLSTPSFAAAAQGSHEAATQTANVVGTPGPPAASGPGSKGWLSSSSTDAQNGFINSGASLVGGAAGLVSNAVIGVGSLALDVVHGVTSIFTGLF